MIASPHFESLCAAEWSKKLGVHLLAAGIALSATLGQCHIAEAGVVLEQPKSRKVRKERQSMRAAHAMLLARGLLHQNKTGADK